jgi:hypothetical protein
LEEKVTGILVFSPFRKVFINSIPLVLSGNFLHVGKVMFCKGGIRGIFLNCSE